MLSVMPNMGPCDGQRQNGLLQEAIPLHPAPTSGQAGRKLDLPGSVQLQTRKS